MRMVLAHDRPQMTGYDQDLWADRLRYDRADVEQALQELALLRRSNLGLLEGASAEDQGAEGQEVGGADPFGLGLRRAEVFADGGKGEGGDGPVDVAHRRGEDGGDQDRAGPGSDDRGQVWRG